MSRLIFATIQNTNEKILKQHIVTSDSDEHFLVDGKTLCGIKLLDGDIDDEKIREKDVCKTCIRIYEIIKNQEVSENTLAIKPEFIRELEDLINRHSVENGSDTPDFILREYLINCLKNFNTIVIAREKWYGRQASCADDGFQFKISKDDTRNPSNH